MATNFKMVPTAPESASLSVLFGAGNTPGDRWDNKEQGKIIKYVADSRYDLCAVGDEIEGFVQAVEQATQNGYSFGTMYDKQRRFVRADGLQATPGVGTIAVGDYVVCGSVTAKGTVLPDYPKVCKATSQANAKATPYAWRVLAIMTGTGVVGDKLTIGRVGFL